MSGFLLLSGCALILLGGGLAYVGLPRDGMIRSFAATGLSGQVYTFAIIISLLLGGTLLLNGVIS